MSKSEDKVEKYTKSHSYKWWAKKYRQYKRDYYKRVDRMIEEGLTPYSAEPEEYKYFKIAYAAERNDRMDDIAAGRRKSMGDINKTLISNGVYEISEKQAYAIFDYMKTLSPEERKALNFSYRNINTAIAKIRTGEFVSEDLGLWDLIKERRAQLFQNGYSKKEVKEIISQEFFYPKEKK